VRFEDFIVEWKPVWSKPVDHILDLHRTYCACHWKEVWVTDFEQLPYLCHRLKELPAGKVGLEAAIL
jgi:hypothetical protein